MAAVDDFSRSLEYGYIPGDLALAITANADDATLLRKLARGNGSGRTITSTLVTSLNTLTDRTLTANQWTDTFRQQRIQPVRV